MGRFTEFGGFVGGIVGIYMRVWIFKLSCSQAFAMIQIYKVIETTWKIIKGCIPYLAKHVFVRILKFKYKFPI